MTPLKKYDQILSLVSYFHVFKHPLTASEIQKFLGLDLKELKELIVDLEKLNVLTVCDKYVGLDQLEDNIKNRLQGNYLAEKLEEKSRKNARIIYKFPYVRGVLISGSFSKGVVSEKGDIDYFIITKSGRLWIARTLLVLYKKIFLLNSHEFFCVNYFIDEENLEIEEKNLFTATELITLLPMINQDLYEELIRNNEWVKDYYPTLFHQDVAVGKLEIFGFKRTFEKVLRGRFGEILDRYFMKMTLKRWQKKFDFLAKDDFEVAMKTTTNISKHHPNNFQKKVLAKHESILSELMIRLGEKINVKTAI